MYKVIDNFLDTKQFEFLQTVLFAETLPWFYRESLVKQGDNSEHGWYNHCIYNKKPQSNVFELMDDFIKKLNIVCIDEIRVNSMYFQEKPYESKWHTDRDFKCKTGLFYLNTCNGYTLLKTDPISKIESISNRMLIFDSQVEHKAVSQTDTKRRLVINFNYFDHPSIL